VYLAEAKWDVGTAVAAYRADIHWEAGEKAKAAAVAEAAARMIARVAAEAAGGSAGVAGAGVGVKSSRPYRVDVGAEFEMSSLIGVGGIAASAPDADVEETHIKKE